MKAWKKVLAVFVVVCAVFLIYSVINYRHDLNQAYVLLETFDVKTIDTSFGPMSFVESGSSQGEPVILIHGIFGGYDQASVSLNSLLSDEYYKIAPSRFGYPGTACPENPTPERQADQVIELMDNLGINQTYIIGTSAGGPATYQLALKYSHRVKGIVLLSTGAPYQRKTAAELDKELTGPPSFAINDPVMWTAMNYFGGLLQNMFGGDTLDRDLMVTILPVAPRRAGIIADSEITNKDMSLTCIVQ